MPLKCTSISVVIWGRHKWPLRWQTVFFRWGVAVIIHISDVLDVQLTLMALIDLLGWYDLATGYDDRAKGSWVIKHRWAALRLMLYLTVIAITNVSVDQLVRWHSRLLVAQVLWHDMLLQGSSANLWSLIYLSFEHEEVSERTIILTAKGLAGDERWKDTLLSIGTHLPQHVLIILILVVWDLRQSNLIPAILVLIFLQVVSASSNYICCSWVPAVGEAVTAHAN